MNELVKKYNFKFKKKYGQNFITDRNILNLMINKSEITKDSLVIEIGPGLGALTLLLAEKAKKVLCYEIDTDLEKILSETIKDYNNIEIIYADFLKRDVNKDINKKYKNIYLVSNLPYYITTPIINKIIKDNILIKNIIIMVQKEVGERFMANPKTKAYNSLSVFIDYHFIIKKILNVSRNVFVPKPNVDSIVLKLERRETPKVEVNDKDLFFKFVKDAFKYKRKILKNNLKEYDLIKIATVLETEDLDLKVRAEALTIEQLAKIFNFLNIEK